MQNHNGSIIKTSLKKIYHSLYLKGCMWEGVGDRTKTATYWPPQPLRTSPCVVLVLLGCSTGAWGPSLSGTCSHSSIFSPTDLQTQSGIPQRPLLLGGGFPYHILSPTHLISNSETNWLPVFTELYNSSITHSI